MKRIVVLLAVATVGPLGSGVAQAARPPLSLARADQAALVEAKTTVQAWWDAYTDDNPFYPAATVYISAYYVDPCEREARRAAGCDVTYTLSDDTFCDSTINVHTTRRNKLSVVEEEPVCDDDA